MLTASTEEFDDIDSAVADVLRQLDLKNNRLKHTAAVITCYSEFGDTGVLQAVADALECDCTGCVSLYSSVGQPESMLNSLCVSVLTADDAEFKVVKISDMERPAIELKKDYLAAKGSFARPKLILGFFPLVATLGGEIGDRLAEAVDGAPLFGTVTCDEHSDYRTTATIVNGELCPSDTSLLLISGNVNPRFYMTGIPLEKIQKQKAIITSSKGCLVSKVNDMPVIEYLQSLGLAKASGLEGMAAIPIIVDYNDGTKPVARAMYKLTEQGLICGGIMPENATLAIGSLDVPDILACSEKTISNIMTENKDIAGMFVFPCMSRLMALGTNPDQEFDVVSKTTRGGVPFHLCYSGGEACPVYDDGGEPVNRFHNFSIVALVL